MKKIRLENALLINSIKKTSVNVTPEYVVTIAQGISNNIQGRDSANTISIPIGIAANLANALLDSDVKSAHFHYEDCSTIDLQLYRHHNIIVIEETVTFHIEYPSSVFSIVLTDNEAQEIALFIKRELQ